jgi:hypothetical protein
LSLPNEINETILQALKGLEVAKDTNIDETCALINRANLHGSAWQFTSCNPDADADDMLLITAVVNGESCLMEIPLDIVVDEQGPSTS